jgi:hypothetical protein
VRYAEWAAEAGEDEEEDTGMRGKVWDGMRVSVCIVLPNQVEKGGKRSEEGLSTTTTWIWTGMCVG